MNFQLLMIRVGPVDRNATPERCAKEEEEEEGDSDFDMPEPPPITGQGQEEEATAHPPPPPPPFSHQPYPKHPVTPVQSLSFPYTADMFKCRQCGRAPNSAEEVTMELCQEFPAPGIARWRKYPFCKHGCHSKQAYLCPQDPLSSPTPVPAPSIF